MTSMQLAAPGLKCWQCGSPAGRSKDGIGACGRHLLPGRNERKAMLKAAAKPPKASRPVTTKEKPRAVCPVCESGRYVRSVASVPMRSCLGCHKRYTVYASDESKVQLDAPARKGPVVNGQQFAPGYTREAAEYEAKAMADPCQTPEPTHIADPTSTADMCQVPAWTPEQSAAWLDGVTFGKPASYRGHKEISVHWEARPRWDGTGPEPLRLTLVERNAGEWDIERERTEAERQKARSYQSRETLSQYKPLPLRSAKIVAARELKGYPMPGTTRTRYSGSEPLRRERWWVTNEGDMMASAKARVRSGAALAALQAEAEFIIHPEGYAA